MGSISEIFTNAINFITGLVDTGSFAAGDILNTGSEAADSVFNQVTGSLTGIVNEGL